MDRFVEIEYLPFPVGEYDDFFDMMSRLEDSEIKSLLVRPMKSVKKKPRPRPHYSGDGSWLGG
jgi:hypothetical protein